jgi:hypothetical protein
MAWVYGIAEQHGGLIEVRSSPSTGWDLAAAVQAALTGSSQVSAPD